ncbi:hypothetical protein BSY19_5291 (plasmid) [Bosea sp. RAC05]|nr:hypothetical protein BSY19_5291 [Bosea sp. RAC05]
MDKERFGSPWSDLWISNRWRMLDLFSVPAGGPVAHGIVAALSDEQLAAAEATASRVVVVAGAGTGKTRTLVERIGHLVTARSIDPQDVWVVTYTNKAAKEVRSRLADRLGKASAGRLVMGTFHSLAARILRRNAAAAGIQNNFVIADDDDSDRIFRTCIETLVPENAEGRAERINHLATAAPTAIRRWKCWGLTIEDIEERGRPRRSDEDERFAAIYVAYQHELERRGLLDFGDLVLKATVLLEQNEDVLAIEAGSIRHLLVDEAQDANQVQVRFAALLASRGADMFVVGDADQSIFSFQGGYPEAMAHLGGPEARHFNLTLNRRCTSQILKPAVTLVNWNRRKQEKNLRSDREGQEVGVAINGGEREEASAVVGQIKQLVASGAGYDDIAVLVRSSFVIPAIEELFLRAAIPYELTGGASITDREETRDIAAYLRLAANPHDDLAFSRIVNRPVRGLGPVAEHAIVDRALKAQMPFYEACIRHAGDPAARLAPGADKALLALGAFLDRIHRALSQQDAESEELVAMTCATDGAGYGAYAARGNDRKAKRRVENVAAIARIAREEPDIVAFLERIALSGEISEEKRTKGSVTISTMHSSKGLEWDHVLCPAFDGGVIPSPRALREGDRGKAGDRWKGPSGGGMEEERRLAHVAFTRARQSLWVSSPTMRSGRRTDPSCFLPESGLDLTRHFDPLVDPSSRGGPKFQSRGSSYGRKGFHRR